MQIEKRALLPFCLRNPRQSDAFFILQSSCVGYVFCKIGTKLGSTVTVSYWWQLAWQIYDYFMKKHLQYPQLPSRVRRWYVEYRWRYIQPYQNQNQLLLYMLHHLSSFSIFNPNVTRSPLKCCFKSMWCN